MIKACFQVSIWKVAIRACFVGSRQKVLIKIPKFQVSRLAGKGLDQGLASRGVIPPTAQMGRGGKTTRVFSSSFAKSESKLKEDAALA